MTTSGPLCRAFDSSRQTRFGICLVWMLFAILHSVSAKAAEQSGAMLASQPTFRSESDLSTANVTGKPYLAHRVLHSTRVLPDGVPASHDFSIREARDSQGRLYQEMQTEMPAAPGKPRTTFFSYMVLDPTARTMLLWNSLNKLGMLRHLPATKPVIGSETHAPSSPVPVVLGHRMISGMLCTGYEIQTTIPAGRLGNSTPIVSRHEWWMNDDLHVRTLDILDDPVHGKQTNELISMERGEPDPKLFHLPEGYTVREFGPPGQSTTNLSASQALDLTHAPAVSHDMALAMLSSQDQQERRSGAAALVKEAQASSDPAVKDDVAYRLARANVGLPEAQALAESAVKEAEAACGKDVQFQQEITLARYWHTLGFVFYSADKPTEAQRFMEQAWKLDALAYYGAHLARMAETAGDTKTAVSLYRQALQAPGSDKEKALISGRISALAGNLQDVAAHPGNDPMSFKSPHQGFAVFDLLYGTGGLQPTVRFVRGTDALRSLVSSLASGELASFSLPDHGPECILRRVEVTCTGEASGMCSVHILSAHAARASEHDSN